MAHMIILHLSMSSWVLLRVCFKIHVVKIMIPYCYSLVCKYMWILCVLCATVNQMFCLVISKFLFIRASVTEQEWLSMSTEAYELWDFFPCFFYVVYRNDEQAFLSCMLLNSLYLQSNNFVPTSIAVYLYLRHLFWIWW